MMEANPLYPGPKQCGPDSERYRLKDPHFFDNSLKFCLNCKRCEVACPSEVKVGDIISRAKLKYAHNEHKLRNAMLSSTDFMGNMASVVAPIANTMLSLNISKSILDAGFGVSKHANMPKYASPKFVKWFEKHKESQDGFTNFVEYFHGCYVNYNYPQLGKDFVKVINACGYGVKLLDKQKCCGVALIANGFEKQARKAALTNLASIQKASSDVLSTSSSCTLTLKEEYENILGLDCSVSKEKVKLAVKWVFDKLESGEVRLEFKEDFHMKLAYHTPCHMQKLGHQFYTIELLRRIPGLELTILEQKCCGIAGTFGFKKENYEISQKIGSALFKDIKALDVEAVVTDCETCKWQIEAGTQLPVFNPISILAMALK